MLGVALSCCWCCFAGRSLCSTTPIPRGLVDAESPSRHEAVCSVGIIGCSSFLQCCRQHHGRSFHGQAWPTAVRLVRDAALALLHASIGVGVLAVNRIVMERSGALRRVVRRPKIVERPHAVSFLARWQLHPLLKQRSYHFTWSPCSVQSSYLATMKMLAPRGLVHSLVVFLFSVVLAASEEQQRQFDYLALVRCGVLLLPSEDTCADCAACALCWPLHSVH